MFFTIILLQLLLLITANIPIILGEGIGLIKKQ